MADRRPNLRGTQRWFHTAITDPAGTAAGISSDAAKQYLSDPDSPLSDIVLPSKSLSSVQRLSIYGNMYFERLADILADEFPSVRHLLGPQNFTDVVRQYVVDHPSTHYSLAKLGKAFPQFLLDHCEAAVELQREFASAVATVERAMEDVFDERQVEPLGVEEVQSIQPQNWNDVRLKTISALRLLDLPFPVNDYVSAVRDGQSIDVPDARRTFVAIYRHKYQVWRIDLDERQFVLLRALQKGETLSEAVSNCAEVPGSDVTELSASLGKWFRDWAVEGLFCKLDVVNHQK